MLTSMLTLLMLPAVQSQVTQDTIWTDADVTLGSGTGQDLGDYKDRNLGADGSMEICNFDDNESLMSYFESWAKFDLSSLEAAIPEGQEILYAEIVLKVSANTGQGYYAYHLMDADDWVEGNGSNGALSTEGGLTWTDAQAYDYENEANYTLIKESPECGGTSWVEEFNVTEAVKYEMGAEGNKILTIRFAPYISEYDPVTSPKEWLGFYSRQSPWGAIHPDLGIATDAAHIIFYIGPEEPTVFSDIASFGDITNYANTPSKYGFWLVRDDEGDARLKLSERPSPINGTPGGVAVYDVETYGDFDISLKAKLNKISGGALDPKADFIVAFGYSDISNYAYIRFTGEDINGFYLVDTSGAVEVGTLNTTPAVSDTAYHNYRLVRSGTTVTAYIDDVEYMAVTDDALGTAGMIGVGSYNDVALFDDFAEGAGGTGIFNDVKNTSFSVYPNPAADILNIDAESPIQKLVISNIVGQEIRKLHDLNSGSIMINISDFETGVYFISVDGVNGRSTSKFIKK